jgi:hypothetical protein
MSRRTQYFRGFALSERVRRRNRGARSLRPGCAASSKAGPLRQCDTYVECIKFQRFFSQLAYCLPKKWVTYRLFRVRRLVQLTGTDREFGPLITG